MEIKDIELVAQQHPDLGLTGVGVTSHLNRVRIGSAPTPRSWLYEDVAPEKVVDQVLNILESHKASYDEIVTDDLHYVDKIGPQGGTEPWSVTRRPLLEESFAPQEHSSLFESPLWVQAKKEVIKKLQFRQTLRPRALETVVKFSSSHGGLSTNSGLPDFTRRSKVLDKALADVRSGKWKEYPAVIGSRSQRKKERNIFMYPFSANLRGFQFQQALQEHIRKLNLPEYAAWEGLSRVEDVIQPFMDKRYFKLSSDYSAMDNHFRAQHTLEVFDVVKHAFQKRYWDELLETMLHTHTIPILTPDGVVYGEHGVASGSEWTNFLETVFQDILWTYIKLKRATEGKAPIDMVMFLGDDAAAFSREPLTDDFVEAATAVKFVANFDKQHESVHKVHYLRRWYYNYYRKDNRVVGVYPLTLNINSQVFPERFHDPRKWNGRMFVLRSLMILENSVGHPAFEEYGKFVLKGNPKHFREFAKLGDKEVTRAVDQARAIAGFVPSYNQEKIDKPITAYESYRLLREMYA